ncbi:MAG: hypothetical protein HY611_03290 [Elusimicrobia bacterium]|nr:hypothetical protein [Elusimicrobiota bacterium]
MPRKAPILRLTGWPLNWGSAHAPAAAGFKGLECLAGSGACPPEDCGGIGGYEDLLAALRDPATIFSKRNILKRIFRKDHGSDSMSWPMDLRT